MSADTKYPYNHPINANQASKREALIALYNMASKSPYQDFTDKVFMASEKPNDWLYNPSTDFFEHIATGKVLGADIE